MRLAGAASLLLLAADASAQSVVNVKFDSGNASCPNNPSGRRFHGAALDADCWELHFDLDVVPPSSNTANPQPPPFDRFVRIVTCPRDGTALNVTSSPDLGEEGAVLANGTFTAAERTYLCNLADAIENGTGANLNDVTTLDAQAARAARMLCEWPVGLIVSYDLGDAPPGRNLTFVPDGDGSIPPASSSRRSRRLQGGGSGGTGIQSLCDDLGSWLGAVDGSMHAKVDEDPPCNATDRGMTIWNGTHWVCRERGAADPPFGLPNPPEWAYGDCFGRCSEGCSGGHVPITADCADYDFCVRFGITDDAMPFNCNGCFFDSIDDRMLAGTCGADGDGGCPAPTVGGQETPDTGTGEELSTAGDVLPWIGFRRSSPDHAFIPYVVPGFSENVMGGFANCSDLEDAIHQAASYLANEAIENNAEYECYYHHHEEILPVFAEAPAAEGATTTSADRADGLDDSYETNVQEAGVDEADLIKTDGQVFAAGYGDQLFIWNASDLEVLYQLHYFLDNETEALLEEEVDPPTAERCVFNATTDNATDVCDATADNTDNATDRHLLSILPPYYWEPPKPEINALLLESNRLVVVITTHHRTFAYDDVNQTILSESPRTHLRIYDMSDPTNLEQLGKKKLGGRYIAGRSIKDIGHVVTANYLNTGFHLTNYFDRCREEYKDMNRTEYIEAATNKSADVINSFVARLKDELTEDGGSCTNIVQISTFQTADDSTNSSTNDTESNFDQAADLLRNFVRITSFDIDANHSIYGGEIATEWKGVFTPSQTDYVYASEDIMIVPAWGYNYDAVTGVWKPSTLLWAFALQDDGSAAQGVGVGKVPGSTTMPGSLNQFSMDEYRGYLRIATTNPEQWGCIQQGPQYCDEWGIITNSSSQLTILRLPLANETNNKMEQVAQVTDLGITEQIYAVRFMDDKAFIVTFRRTDPFYTTDLSNVTNPRLVGELANITGYSNYLHPFDADGNIILAVGDEADQDGRVLGLQIALFNTTDLTDPTLLHKYFDGKGASSGAQTDHKAFRFIRRQNSTSGVLILPVSQYTYNAKDNFDGFKLYDVSLDGGIEYLFNVTHDSSSWRYYYCPWGGGCLPPRSFLIGGMLTTTKYHSVIETDLQTEEGVWKLILDSSIDEGIVGPQPIRPLPIAVEPITVEPEELIAEEKPIEELDTVAGAQEVP